MWFVRDLTEFATEAKSMLTGGNASPRADGDGENDPAVESGGDEKDERRRRSTPRKRYDGEEEEMNSSLSYAERVQRRVISSADTSGRSKFYVREPEMSINNNLAGNERTAVGAAMVDGPVNVEDHHDDDDDDWSGAAMGVHTNTTTARGKEENEEEEGTQSESGRRALGHNGRRKWEDDEEKERETARNASGSSSRGEKEAKKKRSPSSHTLGGSSSALAAVVKSRTAALLDTLGFVEDDDDEDEEHDGSDETDDSSFSSSPDDGEGGKGEEGDGAREETNIDEEFWGYRDPAQKNKLAEKGTAQYKGATISNSDKSRSKRKKGEGSAAATATMISDLQALLARKEENEKRLTAVVAAQQRKIKELEDTISQLRSQQLLHVTAALSNDVPPRSPPSFSSAISSGEPTAHRDKKERTLDGGESENNNKTLPILTNLLDASRASPQSPATAVSTETRTATTTTTRGMPIFGKPSLIVEENGSEIVAEEKTGRRELAEEGEKMKKLCHGEGKVEEEEEEEGEGSPAKDVRSNLSNRIPPTVPPSRGHVPPMRKNISITSSGDDDSYHHVAVSLAASGETTDSSSIVMVSASRTPTTTTATATSTSAAATAGEAARGKDGCFFSTRPQQNQHVADTITTASTVEKGTAGGSGGGYESWEDLNVNVNMMSRRDQNVPMRHHMTATTAAAAVAAASALATGIAAISRDDNKNDILSLAPTPPSDANGVQLTESGVNKGEGGGGSGGGDDDEDWANFV